VEPRVKKRSKSIGGKRADFTVWYFVYGTYRNEISRRGKSSKLGIGEKGRNFRKRRKSPEKEKQFRSPLCEVCTNE